PGAGAINTVPAIARPERNRADGVRRLREGRAVSKARAAQCKSSGAGGRLAGARAVLEGGERYASRRRSATAGPGRAVMHRASGRDGNHYAVHAVVDIRLDRRRQVADRDGIAAVVVLLVA